MAQMHTIYPLLLRAAGMIRTGIGLTKLTLCILDENQPPPSPGREDGHGSERGGKRGGSDLCWDSDVAKSVPWYRGAV